MRRDALIPSSAQGAPRIATEVSLAASQAYALLQSQAIQKASMFSSLLEHWCTLTGEALPQRDGPALLVEISLLAPLMSCASTSSIEWITQLEQLDLLVPSALLECSAIQELTQTLRQRVAKRTAGWLA
ncbi:hypothetical protein KBY65_09715 [Cyanobium sp. Alchichica 3B3-8F6]|uniref:hypothetical protein n=1 Tax=Synechococcales TaxID=1890424 RepID=UPI000B97FDC8|nr:MULTISPECIES: hypothetical protein [Synechococcales]MCP9882752.1 hypothetical protein [Cyanobium sp. Alchichica 3B3-8F6]MCP9941719.1 hypothetical protein [Cyanobium sp. ATX 6E8]